MKTLFFCLLLSGIVLPQAINNLSDAIKYYSGKATEMLKNGGDPNVLVDNEPAICYLARVEGITSHYIILNMVPTQTPFQKKDIQWSLLRWQIVTMLMQLLN